VNALVYRLNVEPVLTLLKEAPKIVDKLWLQEPKAGKILYGGKPKRICVENYENIKKRKRLPYGYILKPLKNAQPIGRRVACKCKIGSMKARHESERYEMLITQAPVISVLSTTDTSVTGH